MDARLAAFFLGLVLLVVWRWSQYRRQVVWGAALTLPLTVANVLIAGSLADIGFTTRAALQHVAVFVLGVSALGGLLATGYEIVTRRWLSSMVAEHRQRLLWLIVGCVVAVGLAVAHVPLVVALLVGMLINVLLVTIIGWQMLWDVTIGAIGFALWYMIADAAFGFRVSGDISAFLIGPQPIGLTIAGLAPERLILIGGLGLLIGPLFVAIKRYRLPQAPITQGVATWKLVVSACIAVALAAGAWWVTLTFMQAPRVVSVTPEFNATDVARDTTLTVQFDRAVSRESLTASFTPAVSGSWSFTEATLDVHGFRSATFTPDVPWQPGLTYTGTVNHIQSFWGQVGRSLRVRFTVVQEVSVIKPLSPNHTVVPEAIDVPLPEPVVTPPVASPVITSPTPSPTVAVASAPRRVELTVPLDYQDQPLSCEAAALKMALAAKGVKVSESQIMKIVGYDPTPHRGNVWGDPQVAFVGNIAGKQNTTGYGVYWEPIARAANTWRTTKIITNGTFADLTSAIDAGQAVVIWGTLGKAYRDDWTTPAGKKIVAWKGEHARTLIGYIGPAAHPTSFIINDPVVGRVTWSAATMRSNWSSFSNSAVIVQ